MQYLWCPGCQARSLVQSAQPALGPRLTSQLSKSFDASPITALVPSNDVGVSNPYSFPFFGNDGLRLGDRTPHHHLSASFCAVLAHTSYGLLPSFSTPRPPCSSLTSRFSSVSDIELHTVSILHTQLRNPSRAHNQTHLIVASTSTLTFLRDPPSTAQHASHIFYAPIQGAYSVPDSSETFASAPLSLCAVRVVEILTGTRTPLRLRPPRNPAACSAEVVLVSLSLLFRFLYHENTRLYDYATREGELINCWVNRISRSCPPSKDGRCLWPRSGQEARAVGQDGEERHAQPRDGR